MALLWPLAHSVVPSIGSTATSASGPRPSPTCSPLYSMGAWSFSPSPMTTTPFMLTVPMRARIASTAAPSPPFLSPRPTQRPAAIAAASVTRTSSRARLRSGAGRSARKAAPELAGRESGSDTQTSSSDHRVLGSYVHALRPDRPATAASGGGGDRPSGVRPPVQADVREHAALAGAAGAHHPGRRLVDDVPAEPRRPAGQGDRPVEHRAAGRQPRRLPAARADRSAARLPAHQRAHGRRQRGGG